MSESITSETLTSAMIQRGAIDSRAAPLTSLVRDRPWFVSTLLGVAGWLAGIFVLVFIVALFQPKLASQFAVFALVLLPAAFGLYAADRHNAFFDQLALALSIAGQIAAAAAIGDATKSSALTAGAMAILQCVLLVVMPNALARSIAAFFACIAWALAIRFAWWGEWDWGRSLAPVALVPAIIGWFVIWMPIAAIASAAIASEPTWMARKVRRIVRPGLSGMLLALAFGTFTSVPLDAFELLWNAPQKPQTNWLVLWPLLNVAAALVAGLGAFRLRNNSLLGVAVAAALLHVMQFYYLLGTTLVVKSTIMLIAGVVLLSGGVLLRRRHHESELTP